jgi:hypothetical protein
MSFMIVGYPWPVPSAHVELTGTNRRATRPHQTTGSAADSQQENPGEQSVIEADQQRRILTAAKA